MNNKEMRITCLKIMEVLQQESDVDRPISSMELIRILGERGVAIDRKTLARYIDTLNSSGYEVLSTRSSQKYYYILNRKFDVDVLLNHIING